jgi:hypothetical protein
LALKAKFTPVSGINPGLASPLATSTLCFLIFSWDLRAPFAVVIWGISVFRCRRNLFSSVIVKNKKSSFSLGRLGLSKVSYTSYGKWYPKGLPDIALDVVLVDIGLLRSIRGHFAVCIS